jgi:uncharacterized protein (TIGR02391 family)
MSAVPPFSDGQVESLAKLLGECDNGTIITHVLNARGLEDRSGESTKWKRLAWVFRDCQARYQCANRILDFIQAYLDPARFVGRSETFDAHRQGVNTVLAFSGLEFGSDGKFRSCDAANTLNEAEARVRTIRSKFQGRQIHPEVLKYCRVELLQDNYFHAVFEATKGLAQRIRDMSGIQLDGAALVDKVFASERPILAINSLQSETEKSEHKGFASLLKGCFAGVRNPLAHEPKLLWQGEEDAADYLSLISLLHRKLDTSVPTGSR